MEIKIEHLSKMYGNQTVLDDISLHISSGTYGILGGNGAGKTTLLRILASLSEPSSGIFGVSGHERLFGVGLSGDSVGNSAEYPKRAYPRTAETDPLGAGKKQAVPDSVRRYEASVRYRAGAAEPSRSFDLG